MPNFPRGARPSPRYKLLAAAPHVVRSVAPLQFAVIPRQLDLWGNGDFGDCVTAEEAWAKAWWSTYCGLPETFISAADVVAFARAYGFLNGASLTEVMDVMAVRGMASGGQTYRDGGHLGVNYADEAVLQNAISNGPVKIAIDADALPSGAGNQQGWYTTSSQHHDNTDHCVGIGAYGRADYLYDQLKVSLPPGLSASTPGYIVFTWATHGFVTHGWIRGTCVESWLRTPTTLGQSPSPKPPPPPPPPPPGPAVIVMPDVPAGTYQRVS